MANEDCGREIIGNEPVSYDARYMPPLALTWDMRRWRYWCSARCAAAGSHVDEKDKTVVMILAGQGCVVEVRTPRP